MKTSDIAPENGVMANAPKMAAFVVCVVLLTFAFHTPRLWLMTHYNVGTFQWDRAHTFLLQVDDPYRNDVEPAMRWRILPPLLLHYLGIRGYAAFAFPWIGMLAVLGYLFTVLKRQSSDDRFVFGGLLTIANTAVVIVPMHWFGINDGWISLALLVCAFSPSGAVVAATCLLAPWVDERFLIGLPIVLAVRWIDTSGRLSAGLILPFAPVLIYSAVRLIAATHSSGVESHFVEETVFGTLRYIGLAPLGWWMGLNLGLAYVIYAFVALEGRRRLVALVALPASAIPIVLLAADMSRSSAIAIPLVVFGMLSLARRHVAAAPRIALWIGIIALLMPMMHVVGRKLDPIEPIFIELLRLSDSNRPA